MGTPDSPTDRLRQAWEAGRRAHGALDVGFEPFAVRGEALVRSRVAALGLEATPGRIAEWVERAAQEDLYLAIACDLRVAGAWARLEATLKPRLRGLALKRGVRDPDADTLAGDVLADMALPASQGASGSLIGTYAGSGSLFAWAAVLLVRRISRNVRRPAAAALEDEGGEPRDDAAQASHEVVEEAEVARKFERAFTEAWKELDDRERLVLAWKHLDGLAQREIGRMLALGESRVSRVVSRAQERLAGSLRARLRALDEVAGRPGDRLWTALAAAVSRSLARNPGSTPPPSRGPSPRRTPHAL